MNLKETLIENKGGKVSLTMKAYSNFPFSTQDPLQQEY